jgi:xylitol oxidase
MGVCGPWFERLPHFRLDFTPSSGEELQSEYILPRQHAIEAFQAIDQLREYIYPLLQISEISTIAADDLWMSPSYGQDCVAIHFTWKKDWEAVKQVLPRIEDNLAQFHARPHWGKLFLMSPEQLQSLYQKLPDFRKLLGHYDPQGKFRNLFLDRCIF